MTEQPHALPGLRMPDVVTGAAVTCAIGATICGGRNIVSLDSSIHVTESARVRLARLGLHPTLVTGEGEGGWPDSAPFDRILASYSVPRVPPACLEQLAAGGRALTHITTGSPSWPALAVIAKSGAGAITGELWAVRYGHRAGHGQQRRFLSKAFRDRIDAREGVTLTHSRHVPPPAAARGFWLALDALFPGLVRRGGVEQLVIGAPACGSWMSVEPDTDGRWAVSSCGPRYIWAEVQDAFSRWEAAGSPASYRLHLEGGGQWARAGTGASELSWPLPIATGPVPRQSTGSNTKDRSNQEMTA